MPKAEFSPHFLFSTIKIYTTIATQGPKLPRWVTKHVNYVHTQLQMISFSSYFYFS